MQLAGSIAMGKKMCWVLIFLTMGLNVILLQSTIESYYGKEYEHVYISTGLAFVSTIVAIVAFLRWRTVEYK